MQNKKIFLSYSTIDEKVVNYVYELLKKSGHKLFKFNRDIANENSLIWGEIGDNIDDADIYCVFISVDSMQSPAVKTEMNAALYKKHKVRKQDFLIIPIYLSHDVTINSLFDSMVRINAASLDEKQIALSILNFIKNGDIPLYEPYLKIWIKKIKDKGLKKSYEIMSERNILHPSFIIQTKLRKNVGITLPSFTRSIIGNLPNDFYKFNITNLVALSKNSVKLLYIQFTNEADDINKFFVQSEVTQKTYDVEVIID